MATTNVKGIVSRINSNGIGFGLRETWQNRDGTEGQRFWGVFMPDRVPVTVLPGDVVEVAGQLRTKVKDGKWVDHTVGNATVTVTTENGQRTFSPDEPPADEYPPTDVWDTTPIPADQETPF